jgi:hypothetical protein
VLAIEPKDLRFQRGQTFGTQLLQLTLKLALLLQALAAELVLDLSRCQIGQPQLIELTAQGRLVRQQLLPLLDRSGPPWRHPQAQLSRQLDQRPLSQDKWLLRVRLTRRLTIDL